MADRLARSILLLPLALCLQGPAAMAATDARPVYREIGDWLLACDNLRNCVARAARDPAAAPVAGDDAEVRMDIARDSGPNGAVTVRLQAEHRIDPTSIHIGTRPLPRDLPWRIGGDRQDASLTGEPARRFVRAIVDAPALMLARAGPAQISLRGLAAVLLAMDEAQGRVGNASALVRPGSGPADLTPPPMLPPRIRVGPPAPALADAQRLARAVRRGQATIIAAHECDRSSDDDAAYPLTRTEAIVVLGCGRFAYQTSVLLFRTPRDRPAAATLLTLPDPPAARPTDAASAGEYVEGDYDPATRTFVEVSKGRGMADCGSATEWTFDGTAFRVSAFRWQDRCAGTTPGEWPVLYQTRR
ncbi:DUF1176 domain-containing protein [Sphingomonas sp. Leaf25]|uniref:DUF1176 domain-containing protein n=1 Tax=Sphingomonas sp. Leaf25 TaxID=1735692 RepID=UPI0006FA8E5A|nr:DUF1176 domain-containing protein [Sphingomonas sp. Leaf25]KQN03853.1 hypothetical protein ASE78_01935 [Sphingomonas sp. Leaf25]